MNKYKVPQRMWRRWSHSARRVFNSVYRQAQDQALVQHPKTPVLPKAEWNTIRWNLAVLAACAHEGYTLTVKKA